MSTDNGNVNSSNDDQITKKAFEMETYLVKTVFGILKSQSVFWILVILYSPSKVRQIAPVRRQQIVVRRWWLDLLGVFLLLPDFI